MMGIIETLYPPFAQVSHFHKWDIGHIDTQYPELYSMYWAEDKMFPKRTDDEAIRRFQATIASC
jgi:hypothetical protein